MTKRDFFRIIIKLFGLYFFIQIIFSVFPSQTYIYFSTIDNSDKIVVIIYSLFVLFISLGILYFLIKNPDKIINFLRLDKNFDTETIDIKNIASSNLIVLGLLIMGGLLILENITYLFSNVFYKFKNNLNNTEDNNGMNLMITSLNIILGILLIAYRKNIAQKIDK
jgi:hypothetical protein